VSAITTAVLILAYVAGSINFALVLLAWRGSDDPRRQFSGNPGTFNVYRVAGLFWASLVLILDVSRAGLIALIALKWLPMLLVPWAGFFLILGNRYPCFHRFKGGKGVANYLGFVIFILPVWGFISALTWPVTYRLFRVTFIPSFIMLALLGFGISRYIAWDPVAVVGTITTLALVVLGHRKNMEEYLKTLQARKQSHDRPE
jgi:glycerol-3-phosphate acyltransferase PlsY